MKKFLLIVVIVIGVPVGIFLGVNFIGNPKPAQDGGLHFYIPVPFPDVCAINGERYAYYDWKNSGVRKDKTAITCFIADLF